MQLYNLNQDDINLFKTICCGIDQIKVVYRAEHGSKSMKQLKIMDVATKDALIFKNSIIPGYRNNALLKKLLAIN